MAEKNINILIKTLNEIKFSDNEKELAIKEKIATIFKNAFIDLNFKKEFDIKKEKFEINQNNIINELNVYKENILRSFSIADAKNNKELEERELEFTQLNEKELIKYNDRKNSINKKIQSKSKQYSDAKISHEKSYEEEIAVINKEINELKEITRIEQNKIELLFKQDFETLEYNYNIEKEKYKEDITNLEQLYHSKISALVKTLDTETKDKDESYLTIKKTHLNSSVRFNDFINEIKSKYAKLESDLLTEHNNKLNDIKIEIEDLDEYFEQAKKLILNEYTEKLKALNVVFDVQKRAHQKLNNEIILEHNREVTNINNRLSINKSNFNEQIKRLEEEKFNEKNKVTLNSDKERINIHYNKLIKKINELIIKEVKKTDLLLYNEEKNFQQKLFNHDYKNVKNLNEWRYQKLIYDKERETNYNIAQSKIENDKFILEQNAIYQNKLKEINLEILKLKLVRELLPIESQLYLSSILQSRDINLLNLEYDSFKLDNNLNVKLLKKEEELVKTKLLYNYEIVTVNYSFEKRMMELKKQLLVEKEIVKRDYEIKKLDLNKDLQQYLLNQRNNRFSNSVDNEIKLDNINLKKHFEQYNYVKNKNQLLLETLKHKKDLTINEIISRNHKLVNNKLTNSNILMMKNESNFNNEVNLIIQDKFFTEHNSLKQLYYYLLDLINTPAHPEVIRDYIKSLNHYNVELEKHYYVLLEHLKAFNLNSINVNLKKVINLKFESRVLELNNINSDNIKVIENTKKTLNNNINILISKTKELEKQLEANILLLNSFKNLNDDKYEMNQTKFLENENKKLSIDIKNNKNTIRNLFKQRKPLEHTIKSNEQLLSFNIKKLDTQKFFELRKIERLNKNLQKEYYIIEKNNKNFLENINQLNISLTKNSYLQDSKLDLFIKKYTSSFKNHNKKMINSLNNVRSFWLNIFNYYEEKEIKYNERFVNITNNYLNLIEKNYNTFEKSKNKELNILNKNYENIIDLLNEQKNNINNLKKESHQSINDLYNKRYLETLTNIENINKISNQKQSTIMDNLNDALTFNQNKLNHTLNKLNKSNIKNVEKIVKDKTQLEHEIKDNLNKTNLKANIFTSRFTKERKFHLNEIKEKRDLYNREINLEYQKVNDDILAKTKVMSKYKVLTKEKIKQLNNEFNDFKTISKKNQRNIVKKDRKELKQNYKFKTREIKVQLKKKGTVKK